MSQNIDSHKFGRKWMSSGLMNKIKLKLQNKDRTTKELREDLERIASEQHVSRSTDNPPRLKFSITFLEPYDLSPSTETSPVRNNPPENSPNLLELNDFPPLSTTDEPLDSERTQVEDTTPTPQDDNKDEMEEDQDDNQETTPSFTPSINNQTHKFLHETDLDDDTLENASYTSDSPTNITADATIEPFQTEEATNESFQTATEELDKANQTLYQHDIQAVVMKIPDEERDTSIKDAIHQELARALHDEELDIQQSQISITLGQQITMATSMDKLLMTRMEKTKLEYKTLQHHQKELAGKNEHLAKELTRLQMSLEQVQQLEQQV
jgi:hypothetical protein